MRQHRRRRGDDGGGAGRPGERQGRRRRPLTATRHQLADNGTVVLRADGFTYTPDDGFVGKDTFTYTASDGTVSFGAGSRHSHDARRRPRRSRGGPGVHLRAMAGRPLVAPAAATGKEGVVEGSRRWPWPHLRGPRVVLPLPESLPPAPQPHAALPRRQRPRGLVLDSRGHRREGRPDDDRAGAEADRPWRRGRGPGQAVGALDVPVTGVHAIKGTGADAMTREVRTARCGSAALGEEDKAEAGGR